MNSMPPDGFADGPPDGFEEQPQQPQGTWDKIKSTVSNVISPYTESQMGSPSSLLQSVPPLLNKAADSVGDATSQYLAGSYTFPKSIPLLGGKTGNNPNPINPTVAAGIGTAVKMAPAIGMSMANPESEASVGNDYAQTQALRAMGAPKRMFKTPQMIDRAKGNAQTLLDQGAIGGDAQGMADKLGELESSSGQAIGNILNQFKDQGKFYNLQDGIEQMESLRPKSQTGQILQGGQYDQINSKINNAVETIKAHMPPIRPRGILGNNTQQPDSTVNFDEANQLKGKLQDAANYGSNKDATLLDKVIAGKFRESLDNSLGQAANDIQDPELAQEFQKQKQIYGSTQFGKDAVYNKLASELANKKIGLTDWILGSHAIATGNPLTAVAEVGAKKLLEKYGASTQANVSNALSKTPNILGPAKSGNAAAIVANNGNPTTGWTKEKEARLQELRRKQQDGNLGN